MDFLGGLCMKEGCNFPTSASRVMRSPRAEEQQPCCQFSSIHQRAVSWSPCAPMRGGKGIEVLSFGPLFSKQ